MPAADRAKNGLTCTRRSQVSGPSRHLNESQRAIVAGKLANLERGNNQHSPIGGTTQAEAATLLNVGKRSVERAREVLNDGSPELVPLPAGPVYLQNLAELMQWPVTLEAIASDGSAVY